MRGVPNSSELEILLTTFDYRTITIVGSSSLVAGNIKNGVTIFGVKGTFTGWVDKERVIFNSKNNVVSGCTYSVGGWHQGNTNWATGYLYVYFDESITKGWNVLWFWAGFGSQDAVTVRTRTAASGTTTPVQIWHNQEASTAFDSNNVSYISIDNISLHQDGDSRYVRQFEIIGMTRFVGLDTLVIKFHN